MIVCVDGGCVSLISNLGYRTHKFIDRSDKRVITWNYGTRESDFYIRIHWSIVNSYDIDFLLHHTK